MIKYIIRRLLQMIPVFLGATFILYFLVYALPGDPWAGRCGDRECPPAYVEAFKREYNLNEPLLVRYALYMGRLLQGDLGRNFRGNYVIDELIARYPTTLKLALIALAWTAVIGITAGIIAALRKGRFIDHLITVSTLVVISIPVFVIGAMSQFAILKTGLTDIIAVTASAGTLQQLILPGIVLGSLSVAYIARLTRTTLVENLRADYVRTAKAKGLTRQRTIGIHALRNSLIPVVTYLGFDFGSLMGGAIVTERIFNINGIGGFIFQSITARDGANVVGAVTILVMVYLLMNLIVDVLYGVLDPRISHD
ncbi:ABC transporter permease [Propioniciclava sp. MC1595]|uniref:ABC transporter permease n=1 Tax=unclassified Propioniciclava TaxID=2642922 RepID=UPI0015FEC9E5|nr:MULTISPECIES: ABC transporter permease [unclassified Propioniciclava]MBB1493597.1 ABC transporter permease [Propioniciclava sp. MC1595]MBB1500097.1 ABC transporter permease [Propioniciclava sp. MC1683]QTE26987.1 ABC transporter permease [Propioniciclava sp. MC1595]